MSQKLHNDEESCPDAGLSAADLKVLRLLQEDAGLSRQDLASASAMSSSTLWRRVSDLQASGAIRKRVALLDPEVVGVPVCVFLSVNLVDHDSKTRQRFESFVESAAEIMECYLVTGSYDYVLIVRSKSVKAFETFLMNEVLGHKSVASSSTQMSLRQFKYTTALPL